MIFFIEKHDNCIKYMKRAVFINSSFCDSIIINICIDDAILFFTSGGIIGTGSREEDIDTGNKTKVSW